MHEYKSTPVLSIDLSISCSSFFCFSGIVGYVVSVEGMLGCSFLTLRFVGCFISIVYLFSYVGFSFFSFCRDVLRCLLCCLYGHICVVLGMNVLAYLILME